MKRIAILQKTASLLPITAAFADKASLQASNSPLKQKVAVQAQTIAAQSARLHKMEAQMHSGQLATNGQPAFGSPALAVAGNPSSPATEVPVNAGVAPSSTVLASASLSEPDTTICGYGEIAYSGYVHDSNWNRAGLKCFNLCFDSSFSENLSLMSEVAVELAATRASDQGEAEIEEALLNSAFNPRLNVKADRILMPVTTSPPVQVDVRCCHETRL